MKCNICPLFESWNNENDSGANCGIFGDDWGNRFQYEDKEGTIVGCYIEKVYIKKCVKAIEECHEAMVKSFLEQEGKIKAIQEKYPPGTRVELVKMDDEQAPPVGTKGTVIGVDDTGSLLMEWDNGSSLNVIYGEDVVRIIERGAAE